MNNPEPGTTGERLTVWTCGDCGFQTVEEERPRSCGCYNGLGSGVNLAAAEYRPASDFDNLTERLRLAERVVRAVEVYRAILRSIARTGHADRQTAGAARDQRKEINDALDAYRAAHPPEQETADGSS